MPLESTGEGVTAVTIGKDGVCGAISGGDCKRKYVAGLLLRL